MSSSARSQVPDTLEALDLGGAPIFVMPDQLTSAPRGSVVADGQSPCEGRPTSMRATRQRRRCGAGVKARVTVACGSRRKPG